MERERKIKKRKQEGRAREGSIWQELEGLSEAG